MSIDTDFVKLSKRIDRLRHTYEKRAASEYRVLYRDVQGVLGKYATKYADAGGKLTFAELQKYDRLQKLEKELKNTIRKHHIEIAKEIRGATRASLVTAHAGTMDIIGTEAGRKIRGILNKETIAAIMQSPHTGMKLNDRLEWRRAELIRTTQETMVRGLVAGERYETIARSLKDVFEGDLNKTITIIRTESHRAHEKGKAEAVDRATSQGVTMTKTWISSKDERVRDDHIGMDGQTVPVDEDFVAPDGSRGPHPGEMGSAAQDINCRCTVAYRVVA